MAVIWDSLGLRFTEPVRDPLWGNILLPGEFGAVQSSPEFVKLSRILQLGPAQLVYPGATHTRRAHSLGVFEMSRRTLAAVAERDGLDFVTAAGARSFLMAALCHDLGHFPYAHSLKELPLERHEALTARIVLGPLRGAVERSGADPAMVAAIVDGELPAADAETRLFRSLLSGVLDPDKLDYLNRDAWACGVPYGVQDVDFILRHVGLDADGRPGMHERGVMAVEGVLFSKYQMYRAVYWHRSVRAATAMIKKAVMGALGSGAASPADLYGLDDAGFYRLMDDPGRDPDGLIGSVFRGALFRPCLELPFDPDSASHRRAADLATRPAMEEAIAGALGSSGSRPAVVVDVPEPISFESDLPVIGRGAPFSRVADVFRPEVVSSFVRSLRVLRVFCDVGTDDEAAAKAARAAASLLGPSR